MHLKSVLKVYKLFMFHRLPCHIKSKKSILTGNSKMMRMSCVCASVSFDSWYLPEKSKIAVLTTTNNSHFDVVKENREFSIK